MKTLNLIAIAVTALLLTISFSSNSYSGYSDDHNCKCCDSTCITNNCCTDGCGTAQGTGACCTDKCTSEKCKECCAEGKCNMKDSKLESGSKEEKNNTTVKSCCDKTGNAHDKNCCK